MRPRNSRRQGSERCITAVPIRRQPSEQVYYLALSKRRTGAQLSLAKVVTVAAVGVSAILNAIVEACGSGAEVDTFVTCASADLAHD
jgi:hypothetical protein